MSDKKTLIGDEMITAQLNEKSKILGISVDELIDRYIRRRLYSDDYYEPPSFVSFLDNTKTFEMMKFMITITIKNIKNDELKSKLKKIINNEELHLENILNTINEKKTIIN